MMLATYPTDYTRLLFETMERAEDIEQGHIFDEHEIVDPFFSSCYVDRCDSRGANAVFASKDIAKGELFCLTPLTLISSEIDFVKLNTQKGRLLNVTRDNLCYYSDSFLSFSYMDMFTNHACHPLNNTKPIDYMVFPDAGRIGEGLVATRDIQTDQEITVDYGTYEYEYLTFSCKCGSRNCVGTYRGAGSYSEQRQDALMAVGELGPDIVAEIYFEASESRQADIEKNFLSRLSKEETFLFYFNLCTLADGDDDDED
jgi:hypothetical protein